MARDSYFTDGFILGAVVGTLLGILFAPNSGEKTRSSIKQWTKDEMPPMDQTKEKVEDLIVKTRQSIEKGFENLGQMVKEGKEPKKTA